MTRTPAVGCFALLCAVLGFAANCHCQILNVGEDTSTPIQAAGHDYVKLLSETVNPADGSVSVRVQTATPPGRGISLPFSFAYDSNGAQHLASDGVGLSDWYDNNAYLAQGGWSYSVPTLSNVRVEVPIQPRGDCFYWTDYVFQDPSGGRHALGTSYVYGDGNNPCETASPEPTQVLYGGDDYYQADLGTSVTALTRIADADGTVYSFPTGNLTHLGTNSSYSSLPSLIEDRNGNEIAVTDSGSGVFTVTDPLGRTMLSSSGFGGSNTLTVSGLQKAYTVTWGTTPVNYQPNSSLIFNAEGDCYSSLSPDSQTIDVVTSIELPNGLSYQFTYDPTYGRVNKITYPNGGYVSYTWGINSLSEFASFEDTKSEKNDCDYQYDSPAITQRTVSFDGQKPALTQTFKYSTNWASGGATWTTKTTTVKTTDNITGTITNTNYTYGFVNAPPQPNDSRKFALQIPVEQTVVYENSGGTALRTVTKSWHDQYELTSQQTLMNGTNSLTNQTTYAYGRNAQVIDKKEYDYGSGAPGTLLRETVTEYQSFGPTAFGVGIFDRPCQTIVYSGSAQTGSRQGETDYYYDNESTGTVCGSAGTPSVTGVSNLTNHDETNYGASSKTCSSQACPRGNATTIVKQCFQGTTACSIGNPTIKYTYDETGHRLSMTDPKSNVTSYSFADSFLSTNTGTYTTTAGAPPSGKVTNAYLTKITHPQTSTSHTEEFTYGYNDGELTSGTDVENSNTTTYRYNDNFDRPTETDYPDNGKTTIAYSDVEYTPSVTTTKLITSSLSESTTATADGMGHLTKTQLTSDPEGTDYTETVYDGWGRKYEVYNPTRCSTITSNCDNESTWGLSTTTYDVLSRVVSVLEADNSTVSTSYTGNCATVTDEAGNARESCVDGAGRMTLVVEDPGASPHLNYWTYYAYDALNDLTSVTQNGSNSSLARDRGFVYDSLARLTSATNPESGTISYTYDLNSNVSTKTAPAPNQTVATNTVTTNYFYDVLNRLSSKNYTDGTTPNETYVYDVAPPWQGGLNNINGRLVWSYNQYAGVAGENATASLYGYDAMGRVLTRIEQTPATAPGAFFTNNTYDLAGDVTSEYVWCPASSVPSCSNTENTGTTITYGYDGAQRLTAVTSSLDDAQHPPTLWSINSSQGYYPQGGVREASFGNGLTQTLSFNNRLQPCRVDVNSTNSYFSKCTDATPSGNLLDLTAGYNAGTTDNGNVASWSAVGNQTFTRSYGYDSLNRIQSMSDSAPNQPCQGMSWTIDAWGNMTAQTGTQGTCYNFSSSVNADNQLQTGYQYDAAGNMTYDGYHYYTYDAENRIIQVDGGSTAGYVYNETGQRVEKKTGSGFTDYFYGANELVHTEWNGGATWPAQYVYAGSELIAEYTSSTTEFMLTDHLGSTRLVTGVNQQVLDSMDYLPFGQQIAGGTSTTHKFTGKESDAESNLDNFGARYFASTMARFMTPDWAARPTAVPYAVFGDPQSLNLYGYVRNDPVTRADADGHAENPTAEDICTAECAEDPKKANDKAMGGGDPRLEAQNQSVSPEVKSAIADSVKASNSPTADDKRGGYHEEGGIWGTTTSGNTVVVPAQPGPYSGPNDKTAHIDPGNSANPALKDNLQSVDGTWHVHPKGGADKGFLQPPSAQDKANAAASINIVVGAGNKRVYFYNSTGVTREMSLKDFMKEPQ